MSSRSERIRSSLGALVASLSFAWVDWFQGGASELRIHPRTLSAEELARE
jgi:hypothetical protein